MILAPSEPVRAASQTTARPIRCDPAMTAATIAELTAALQESGDELSRLLKSMTDRQDARPDKQHWSFREIAAHLEACQVECVLVRIRQIAANAKPTFEFYDNDGWDFSDRDLRTSVQAFNESRRRVIEFARSLSADRLSRTGQHRTFGQITVADYLRIDLDHDREHLKDLTRSIEILAAQP